MILLKWKCSISTGKTKQTTTTTKLLDGRSGKLPMDWWKRPTWIGEKNADSFIHIYVLYNGGWFTCTLCLCYADILQSQLILPQTCGVACDSNFMQVFSTLILTVCSRLPVTLFQNKNVIGLRGYFSPVLKILIWMLLRRRVWY